MTLLIIAMVLHFIPGSFSSASTPPVNPHFQEPKITLVPLNPRELPVRIAVATAENSLDVSWIEYSVNNLTAEEIHDVHVRVFIVDHMGNLRKTEDNFSRERIAGGATLLDRAQIHRTLNRNGLSFIAVTKAVGRSGVWSVGDAEVERAVRAKLRGQQIPHLSVNYEAHVAIEDSDRREIFRLALEDILHDKRKAEKLTDRGNVIVLLQNIDFDLPLISNVNLSALNRDEIQRVADKKERVVYLIYRPIEVEGSHVFARVSLRDERARRPGIYVPFGFAFLFTCEKKNGQWRIEKSMGYAQSVGSSE
jgi:hypothetical protein